MDGDPDQGTSAKRSSPAADEGWDPERAAKAPKTVAESHSHNAPTIDGIAIDYFEGDELDAVDEKLVLLVPDAAVSNIIGLAGVTVTQIQQCTSTKIDIQRALDMVPGQQQRKVTINGTIKNASVAGLLIMMKIREKFAFEEFKMLVPIPSVSFLIGKSGSSINEIERVSGARCKIQKVEDVVPNIGGQTVTLIGAVRSRLVGGYLVSRTVRQYANGAQQASEDIEHDIYVPGLTVPRLIGKRGAFLTELQAKSGAKIQIHREAGVESRHMQNVRVTLTGNKEAIVEATSRINRMVSACHSHLPHIVKGGPASR